MRRTLWTLLAGLCLLSMAGAVRGATADVKQMLKDAATEVSYLSFDKALTGFENARATATEGSEDWQAAVFGEAVCLQQIVPVKSQRINQAAALYLLLAEKYPKSKFAPQSLMALGRIDELVDYLDDPPRREQARQWYEKARTAAGEDSPLASEATLRIAANYVQSHEPEQCRTALSILENWLAKHPSNPLASAMWQYAADTWFFPMGDEKKAVSCYIKADEIGLVEKGREGPTYWRIAVLADRNGLTDTAITYYTKVITKTPTSGKAYESQLALKRLGAPVPAIELFEKRKTNAAATQAAK